MNRSTVALWCLVALLVIVLIVTWAAIDGLGSPQSTLNASSPKVVPTCEDNAALRVRIQRTGEDYLLCFHARYGVLASQPESLEVELPK